MIHTYLHASCVVQACQGFYMSGLITSDHRGKQSYDSEDCRLSYKPLPTWTWLDLTLWVECGTAITEYSCYLRTIYGHMEWYECGIARIWNLTNMEIVPMCPKASDRIQLAGLTGLLYFYTSFVGKYAALMLLYNTSQSHCLGELGWRRRVRAYVCVRVAVV